MKKIYLILQSVFFVAALCVGFTSCNTEDDGMASPTENDSPNGDKIFTVGGVSFTMKKVAGGTFTMGATSEQGSDADDREKPAHQVTLSNYYIGETEVTQALWHAVMGSNPSFRKGVNLPVEQVSWNDCQEFITKLNAMTGQKFRLPTEAEWEFAARGGNKSKGYKYSGSNNIDDVAWYWKNSGDKYLVGSDNDWDYDKISNNNCKTHPVAQKTPNELGIYDMSGNVWEWCSDWEDSYSSDAQTNPAGPSTTSFQRVKRGGGWYYYAKRCRVSCRDGYPPVLRNYDLGLRLACYDYTAGGTPENGNDNDNTSLTGDKTFTVGNVSFMMKPVVGGTFTMGATSEQGIDAWNNEKPTHQVTLSSYYIGETEVTQALWKAIMGTTVRQQRDKANTSWPLRGEGNNYPMYYISWDECQEFITKLNAITGQKFRLPTEAEWEFAARGGNKSKGNKYSGSNNIDNNIDDVAWYNGNSGNNTHAVKTKSPNELGIYDMSGNVSEWCNDWYGDYSSNAQTNPTGPSTGSYRVNRGGSWDDYAWDCRVSDRNSNAPDGRDYNLGLRLAL